MEAISTEELVRVDKEVCKSCGNTFEGNFCNVCGEKVQRASERSFKKLLQSDDLSPSFSKNPFLKSLKLVVIHPGLLASEFVHGRRIQYTKPLQLFFVLNVVYFLFPVLQLFNTSLRTQMYLRTHSPLVREMVLNRIEESGYSLKGYELMYNEKSTAIAKMLVIVFVLLSAIAFNLIYHKRNRFFGDHFTLAIELAAFNLAVNAILLSVFMMMLNKIIHWTHLGWEGYLNDFTLTIIFVLTNIYFLFEAGKNFYNKHGFPLLLNVGLGLLGLFVALEAYRIVLFLVTFWSL